MYVQVDGESGAVQQALARVTGVTRVAVTPDRHDGGIGYEVDSERGQDVRREIAKTVVAGNWGLLELRPVRMSLEEIFLSLTTEETHAEAANE
jgi:ABC-2 type transport system ATP-binding protein